MKSTREGDRTSPSIRFFLAARDRLDKGFKSAMKKRQV
jgi:hypothetical protein